MSNTGGGGGSYNVGLDPIGLSGNHSNHGYTEITLLAEFSKAEELSPISQLVIPEGKPIGALHDEQTIRVNVQNSNDATHDLWCNFQRQKHMQLVH